MDNSKESAGVLWQVLEQMALNHDAMAEDYRDAHHEARGCAEGIREAGKAMDKWLEGRLDPERDSFTSGEAHFRRPESVTPLGALRGEAAEAAESDNETDTEEG